LPRGAFETTRPLPAKPLTKDVRDLREQMIRLGPWHYWIDITPELSTHAWFEEVGSKSEVGFLARRKQFHALLRPLYPNGLEDRRVLDCGCNAGAYLFWAKELGAGECFGFDAREHWIEQARFLAEHRTVAPTDRMRFEVCDLYDLPEMQLDPFDITVFNGLFYHLPDPVTGLKIAADLTKDLMILTSSTFAGAEDGFLYVENESATNLMSGIYGLNWRPTGPRVVEAILRWVGFKETKVLWHRPHADRPNDDHGWLGIAATKVAGRVDEVPLGWPPGSGRMVG
jgi:tRNA (mo5U34)-methyltransferase